MANHLQLTHRFCVLCNKPLNKGSTKYCSLKCWYKVPRIKGKNHPSWKGGRYNFNGYIRLHSNDGKQKLEHRIIMETAIGRKLTSNEIIHHKNGVKDDNRLENLEIVLRTTHFGCVTCPRCRYDFKIK